MTLAEFLKEPRPEEYDFVCDTQGADAPAYSNTELGIFEKFFVYRAGQFDISHFEYLEYPAIAATCDFLKMSAAYQTGDPDSRSVLLQDIYWKLWGERLNENRVIRVIMEQKKYVGSSDGQIHISSDTMTSAQVLMNLAIQSIGKENSIRKIYRDGKGLRYTKNESIAMAANNATTHLYKLLDEKYPHLKDFLSAYHTIGNYCPVPDGFNTARSNYGKDDFWDLTMRKIYNWYVAKNEGEKAEILKELLHSRGSQSNCDLWLKKGFGDGICGWKEFVDTLFLQDYVEEDSPYMPKPFWLDHKWGTGPQLSDFGKKDLEREKALDLAFQEISRRIRMRSQRIVEWLRNN